MKVRRPHSCMNPFIRKARQKVDGFIGHRKGLGRKITALRKRA